MQYAQLRPQDCPTQIPLMSAQFEVVSSHSDGLPDGDVVAHLLQSLSQEPRLTHWVLDPERESDSVRNRQLGSEMHSIGNLLQTAQF